MRFTERQWMRRWPRLSRFFREKDGALAAKEVF